MACAPQTNSIWATFLAMLLTCRYLFSLLCSHSPPLFPFAFTCFFNCPCGVQDELHTIFDHEAREFTCSRIHCRTELLGLTPSPESASTAAGELRRILDGVTGQECGKCAALT